MRHEQTSSFSAEDGHETMVTGLAAFRELSPDEVDAVSGAWVPLITIYGGGFWGSGGGTTHYLVLWDAYFDNEADAANAGWLYQDPGGGVVIDSIAVLGSGGGWWSGG